MRIIPLQTLLLVAIALCMSSDASSQDLPNPTPPLRLTAFTEHSTLQAGDTVDVRVWVESRSLSSAELTVIFSDEHLSLTGDNPRAVSLPVDSPVVLTFTGKNPGQSNILVRVSGINQPTEEKMMETYVIQGIVVQARRGWWSPLFSAVKFIVPVVMLARIAMEV